MGDDDGVVTVSNMLSWMGALIVRPPVLGPGDINLDGTDDFEDRGGDGAAVMAREQPNALVAQRSGAGSGDGGKSLVTLTLLSSFILCPLRGEFERLTQSVPTDWVKP